MVIDNGVKKSNMLKYANRNKPITKQEQEKMIKEAAEHYGRYMTALGE